MSKTTKVLLSLSLAFTLFAFILIATNRPPQQALASVMQGGEYHATTTSPNSTIVGWNVPRTILGNSGTLGSVIITGSGTGWITLYDATTTNANLRDVSQATSTITVASFPFSPTVGVYTYDITLFRGLVYDVNGAQSTTTITYRSNQ